MGLLSPFVNTLVLEILGFLIFHHAEGGLLREDLRQAKPFNLLYGGTNRLRSHPAALCRQGSRLREQEEIGWRQVGGRDGADGRGDEEGDGKDREAVRRRGGYGHDQVPRHEVCGSRRRGAGPQVTPLRISIAGILPIS